MRNLMRHEMNRCSSMISRIMSLALMITLIGTMGLGLSGCSSQADSDADTEAEEPAETAEDTEEVGIYGDASLGIDAGVDEELRDYRTILIAGIDNGNRADMQIVLSLNKKTNEAKIFTVSRDTYMQIADGDTVTIDSREFEFCKCNRAYEVGDKYALMKELNMHLDLNMKEFIGVNWSCAADFINAVGGIEAEVEEPMLEWINQGGGLPDEVQASGEYKIQSAGKQTLNGWQTVQYLRVRKYKGGSARERERRNREVFKQLFDNARNMTIDELSELYDDIADQLDTNMSRNTLTETIAAIADTNLENTENWPYEYNPYWEKDGHFVYFVPDTLISNVKELHANIFDQQDYLPSMTVQVLQGRIDELVDSRLVRKKPK